MPTTADDDDSTTPVTFSRGSVMDRWFGGRWWVPVAALVIFAVIVAQFVLFTG